MTGTRIAAIGGISLGWLCLVAGCGLAATAPVLADTGNCKKSEILRLAKSGFSREEIDEICKETTDSPNCCCAETYDGAGSVYRDAPEAGRERGRVYFVWQSADLCGYRNNYMCVDAKYCGRD